MIKIDFEVLVGVKRILCDFRLYKKELGEEVIWFKEDLKRIVLEFSRLGKDLKRILEDFRADFNRI